MTYGEQAIKYKDSMYLENGVYKASEPPPKESARMPKDEIGAYINAKLEPIWRKMLNEPDPIEPTSKLIKIAREKALAADRLCDRIMKAASLAEVREYAEKLKEVL